MFGRKWRIVAFLLFLVVVGVVRCAHWSSVFQQQRVFFNEADAYARMSRVQLLEEHPFRVIRFHPFENHPDGTIPHTTMPMDWAIEFLEFAVRLRSVVLPTAFRGQERDVAGAFISPFLGLLNAAFLWWWLWRVRQKQSPDELQFPGMALALFAISPMLAHAAILGRPDHQSLLVLLLSVALGLEWLVGLESGGKGRIWAAATGAAWGLALWVSLYEPLVLFALVQAARFASGKWRSFARSYWLPFGAVLLAAFLVEGIRWNVPAGEEFDRWGRMIAELQTVPVWSPLFWRMTGFAVLLVPAFLFARRVTWVPAAFCLIGAGLMSFQARWGSYSAMLIVMGLGLISLPGAARPWKRIVAWAVFVAASWPLLADWDAQLFENPNRLRRNAEGFWLRVTARDIHDGAVLAPWWHSAAAAYWSGQPAVAGSSHESLPGILDSARFFLTSDPAEGRRILEERGVRWVICGNPNQVEENSSALLGVQPGSESMARLLFEQPHSVPPWLRLTNANEGFKLFEFLPGVPLRSAPVR